MKLNKKGIKTMNSRERILKTLNHEEPDKVPFDLGSTHLTGITHGAYRNLREYLGLEEEKPVWSDVIQQLVIPSEELLDQFKVDTRGLFPLTSHNWDVYDKLEDAGENWRYNDEWGMTHHFPKENGHWFSIVQNPLKNENLTADLIINHQWPDAGNIERIKGLREKALQYRKQGKLVMLKGLCAGLFEMTQRIRGMENAMIDSMLYPVESDLLIGKITDLKIDYWKMVLGQLHDVVDVVVESDDYGTQESQLISPEMFREFFKPHIGRLFSEIKKAAPGVHTFFHSCGNVRPIIPDFIEMGVDILNPVHITATGMEPIQLKKDFGNDIVFWGGGVDTQNILPYGTPEQVAENVKRSIEILAPGGGFVFNTIHNIQSEVPPQNIMAMWEALMKFGNY